MINLKSFFKKNGGNFLFLIFIIISVMLLLNTGKPLMKRIQAGGHSFFSFFQFGMNGIESIFTTSVKSIGELKQVKKENALLKKQLMDFSKTKNQNRELILEINKLKEQFNFVKSIPSIYDIEVKQIAAEVLAKQPGNFYTTFVISKGEKDGITAGMPVVALYENYMGMVGKTVTVGYSSSMVLPVFSTSFYTAARFQGSYYEGLVNGDGENSRELMMQYVHKQAKAEIKYGDLIITSGLGGTYPKGIHIGTVKAIKSKTYETSMDIVIQPVIDFSRLEYVYVLDSPGGHGEVNE